MDRAREKSSGWEAIAWGALFVWWGVAGLLKFLPDGAGAVGTGLILLGLNAARAGQGLPAKDSTTLLGVLALVLGGLELLQPALPPPRELPRFPIFLIVSGLILVAYEFRRPRKASAGRICC